MEHRFIISLCLLASTKIYGYRTIKSAEVVVIFAKPAELVDLVCENEIPLARCGFTHPNGTKILFQNLLPGTPSCKYSTEATSSDVGVWTCHFWPQTSPQEEYQKTIEVRVAEKFAAVEREVRVKEGEEVSLSCVTTERMTPLSYCYFMTPGEERIHMDDGITSRQPHMKKYFFPHKKSIHRGDCGVTINSAILDEDGTWSCFGWLESERRQFADTIRLIVEEQETSTEAFFDDETFPINVTTYVCGTVAFLSIFAVLIYYKYKYLSQYYTFGDDDSIASYQIKRQIDNTPLVVPSNFLLIT